MVHSLKPSSNSSQLLYKQDRITLSVICIGDAVEDSATSTASSNSSSCKYDVGRMQELKKLLEQELSSLAVRS